MSDRHVPVLVLGAGLTGLSASIRLRELHIEHLVLESKSEVGGHATTTEEDGFRFDRTGHLLHLRDPRWRATVHGWLPGQLLEIHRMSRVWTHGVYTRYPFQAGAHGLPPRLAYDCVMDFIAAQAARPAHPPRDFEEFCRVHFGAAITEAFMLPYNERLWGVAAREIGVDWCQRFVPIPTLAQVIAGAVGLQQEELGYNAHFLYPSRGIGALPQAMVEHAGPIRLGSQPRSLQPGQRVLQTTQGERLSYDVLLSTAPLPSLLSLIEELPAEVALRRSQLRQSPLRYFDVALRRAPGQPYHWVYVPEARYPFYRVGSYSNFSRHMVPEGCGSLYVELAERDVADPTSLWERTVAGLIELGWLTSPSDVQFHRLRSLDPAYVLYDAHHGEATAAVREYLSQRSVLSVGRYGGWNYSSMEDALGFGYDAAEDALHRLSSL